MPRRTAASFAAMVSLAACSSGDQRVAGSPGGSREEAEIRAMQAAAQGLCDAGALAGAGDFQAASDTFFRSAHGYIHELATSLSSVDPAAGSELLEADQQFEAELASSKPKPATVQRRSLALAREFAEAATVAGLPSPTCQGSAGA